MCVARAGKETERESEKEWEKKRRVWQRQGRKHMATICYVLNATL